MAQGTKCLLAIYNYMRKVKLKYQHVPPSFSHFPLSCILTFFILIGNETNWRATHDRNHKEAKELIILQKADEVRILCGYYQAHRNISIFYFLCLYVDIQFIITIYIYIYICKINITVKYVCVCACIRCS